MNKWRKKHQVKWVKSSDFFFFFYIFAHQTSNTKASYFENQRKNKMSNGKTMRCVCIVYKGATMTIIFKCSLYLNKWSYGNVGNLMLFNNFTVDKWTQAQLNLSDTNSSLSFFSIFLSRFFFSSLCCFSEIGVLFGFRQFSSFFALHFWLCRFIFKKIPILSQSLCVCCLCIWCIPPFNLLYFKRALLMLLTKLHSSIHLKGLVVRLNASGFSDNRAYIFCTIFRW